ncbi:DMT family transporter [Rubrobacter marinus]|uniref:DMT family transporter n=1 Tax=Rubrobacter marinus TaxID=2653852 RepID=UPI00140BDD93|nr:DMT family transporter [Rubrobacter marinus]
MSWALSALAFVAGTVITVQFAVNAELRKAAGGPISAAALSFLIGTLVLFAAVAIARQTPTSLQSLSQAPWWAWAGGFLGAFFVFSSVVLTPRLGAAATFGFIIAGQMITSIVLDQFGLLHLPVQPATALRVLGAVLVVSGAYLVLRF